VGGHVKSEFCDKGLDCKLTIPSILWGINLSIARAPSAFRYSTLFKTPHHSFVVEVHYKVS
jgi:hypothetical protein